ncbi:MAG TPA: hypothetical protein VEV84_12185 [Pyrinomonadaceae bacterium]|nr:hypothetical protein [Pyrinomonadaceae bacterium]
METYITTCENIPDLDGVMEATNGIVESYTNDDGDNGSEAKGSPVSDFKVRFGQGRKYHIKSKPYGSGYKGKANNEKDLLSEETWVATATTKKRKPKPKSAAAKSKVKTAKATPKSKTTRAKTAVKGKAKPVKSAKKK